MPQRCTGPGTMHDYGQSSKVRSGKMGTSNGRFALSRGRFDGNLNNGSGI